MPAGLLKQASKRQYGGETGVQSGGGVWAECKARSQKPLLSVDYSPNDALGEVDTVRRLTPSAERKIEIRLLFQTEFLQRWDEMNVGGLIKAMGVLFCAGLGFEAAQ